jgi:glycosyltransferase involved in cell wall biosynthesis
VKLLVLASAGGDAHRRTLSTIVADAANHADVRVLAPDAEGKALRGLGAAVESWNPAGLFDVLRAIGALQRAAEHHEPDVIHAVGWAAAAVALGALTAAQAARTVVTVLDPIHDGEIPRQFVEKRLPELLGRAAWTTCAYPSLGRTLVERFGLDPQRVEVIPPGVAPLLAAGRPRPAADGPVAGYLSPVDHDGGEWQDPVAAMAFVARELPGARLRLQADAARRGDVRAFGRGLGLEREIAFDDDVAGADSLASLDLVVVPGGRDGLPYSLPQALVDGIPVVASDEGGLAETLAPYEFGWLVPPGPGGLGAGIEAAWAGIDAAWRGAQAQRGAAIAAFDPARVAALTRAVYTRLGPG